MFIATWCDRQVCRESQKALRSERFLISGRLIYSYYISAFDSPTSVNHQQTDGPRKIKKKKKKIPSSQIEIRFFYT